MCVYYKKSLYFYALKTNCQDYMIPLIKRTIVVTATLLMSLAHADAQQLQASRSHYSTDDGLCSNAIAYLVQDDYGYIWIATWNGLSRFDGYNFYNYKTGAGSHIHNLHNRILTLSIDSQQNIWMRMYDNRVFVLKRSIDCIVNPFEGINGNDIYRTNCPIMVAGNGDVMVSIDGVGIYRFKPDRNGFNPQLITTSGLVITNMAEGYQGDIWLGTDQGVHRLDPSNMTVERKGQFLDEYITCIFSNGYNVFAGTKSGKILTFAYGTEPKLIRQGTQAINTLFIDSNGTVWFTDDHQGSFRINSETGEEKFFQQRVIVPDYDGQGGTFNEAVGTIWSRMNHGGYGYYNHETDEMEYFHNDPTNPWNLINTVNASLELDEGVVFESTSRRGLEKLEIMKNTINRFMLVDNAESNLENETRALYFDSEQHLLLIGNKANSLFFLNMEAQLVKTISHDDNGNPIGRAYGISKDSKGNYWLSSKDYGLFRITPTASGNYSVTNMCHDENDPNTLSNNGAYATVEDGDGNIWVATYGGGVNVLTRNKKGQRAFLHPKNGMAGYPYRSHLKVRTITTDADGNVWAGTTDGILIMSCKNGEVKIKKLEESEQFPDSILMSNDIVCLARAADGAMWVGTNGGGIAYTTGKDSDGRWLFANYGAKEGLPGEEIKSITFDQKGNVWFTTDNVICSFNVDKKILTTFSSLDGVDDTMCSEGAAICTEDDDILIGTVMGFYKVDKRKLINANASAIKLRITDFYVNDELQSPRFNDRFDFYVPDSREITMTSHSAQMTFRFASLNYQLQHRVHYQYMMEGYDRGWRNADNSRTASYQGLPSGKYAFKVKAFLLESPERADIKVLVITVPPHFFMSSNAIWLYMLVAAFLCIWLMFWRQGKIQQQFAAVNPGEMTGEKKLDFFSIFKRKKKDKTPKQEETDYYEIMD